MDDFKELTYFLESVLVVCLSEFVGHTKDGRPVQSEIRMQALDRTIQGADCTALKDNGEPRITDDESESDYCSSRNWNKWATNICDSARIIAKTCDGGSRPNGCFNPAFALRLEKQLLPFVPLWTGIMRPHFRIGSVIATSSSVEAEFGDLKHRSFATKLPMRIDLFVMQHLDHLDGKVKLASNPSDLANVDAIPIPVTEVTPGPGYSSTEGDSPMIRQLDSSGLSSPTFTEDEILPIIRGSIQDSDREVSPTFTEDEVSPSFTEDERFIIGSSGESVIICGDINTNNDSDHELLQKQVTENSLSSNVNVTSLVESLSVKPFTGKCFRSSTPDECDDWNVREDWRGKAEKDSPVIRKAEAYRQEMTYSSGKHALKRTTEPNECPVKKRRKPTKLDKCPEWKYIKHVKFGKLPVFKNGNFCLPVNMGKYLLNVRNTCAFDAIFHVILSAIASNEDYVEKLKDTTNCTVKLAQNVVQSTRKLTTASYRERADIISGLGLFVLESFTQTVKRLDATCNVAHLAQYLFADVPSHKTQVSCPCGYNFDTQHALLGINVDVLLCEGFNFMQKAINLGHSTKRTCRKCNRSI